MNPAEVVATWTTQRRVATIAVMLLLTVAIGAGATVIDQETGLGQFETESEELEKLEFIQDHFGDPEEDATTSVQIIIQGENVLDKETLLATISLQQDFKDDALINETLAEDPFTDLATIIATVLIQETEFEELAADQAALEADLESLNETAETLADALGTIGSLQEDLTLLEYQYDAGTIDESTYETERAAIEADLNATAAWAVEPLDPSQAAAFDYVITDLRGLHADLVTVQMAYEQGQIDEYERDEQIDAISEDIASEYDRIGTEVLGEAYDALAARGDELEAEAERITQLDPILEEQHAAIDASSSTEIESMVQAILGDEAERGLLGLLPTDYESGSSTSDARIVVVSQLIDGEVVVEGDAPERIVESQLRMAELVDDRFGADGFVFGQGIITDELTRSLDDSLSLVIPFALLLVIVALLIAYRDVLDILLGVAGIAVVLVWTFGFMGWAGMEFNQIFIAVPVLLIGLSIDYAIHVFMRQREQRSIERDRTSSAAMRIALAGLIVALTWVTATAVFGFLANLVSPVQPIREFGLVSAFGIASALLIFGLLIPATKVTLDEFLESRGIERRKRAFGTGGGMFTGVLSTGNRLARRAPILVLIVAIILTAGGGYAAADIDTSFEMEDFIADEPASWTQHLPEAIRPGEYATKANLQFLDDRFLRQDLQVLILIEGTITEDDTLERLHQASSVAGEQPVSVILADGQPAVTSPLSEMRAVAEEHDAFNAVFDAADTTDDGIPDSNLTDVYDAFFDAAPERASEVIYRTPAGEYEALLMSVGVRGDAVSSDIKSGMQIVAGTVDGDGLSSIATGQVIVFIIIEEELFETVFESLLVSLIAVFVFLMIVYRITDKSATLGIVTLAPIALAVSLILGTMHVVGMPFNVVTGTITSLTIGLGVAYNIHMSERFRLELHRGHDVWEAMYRSVTGTGGALLGSAATTAAGFGVLVLAIIPILQQFGFITAVTIIYAFLGSVLVLPSLLVLWLRYLGPEEYADALIDPADHDER